MGVMTQQCGRRFRMIVLKLFAIFLFRWPSLSQDVRKERRAEGWKASQVFFISLFMFVFLQLRRKNIGAGLEIVFFPLPASAGLCEKSLFL